MPIFVNSFAKLQTANRRANMVTILEFDALCFSDAIFFYESQIVPITKILIGEKLRQNIAIQFSNLEFQQCIYIFHFQT